MPDKQILCNTVTGVNLPSFHLLENRKFHYRYRLINRELLNMYRWGIGKLIRKDRHVVFCTIFYFLDPKKKKAHTHSKPLTFPTLVTQLSDDRVWRADSHCWQSLIYFTLNSRKHSVCSNACSSWIFGCEISSHQGSNLTIDGDLDIIALPLCL